MALCNRSFSAFQFLQTLNDIVDNRLRSPTKEMPLISSGELFSRMPSIQGVDSTSKKRRWIYALRVKDVSRRFRTSRGDSLRSKIRALDRVRDDGANPEE